MELTPNLIVASLRRICQVLHDKRQYLTDLDSPIGDADHGINMDRGFSAVQKALASTTKPSAVCNQRPGRKPLRSSTAPMIVPSVKLTHAGPSQASIRQEWNS